MWERLLGWMVAHAVPRDLTDPHQELIACEAAENGIRQAIKFTGFAAGIALLLVVALIYRTLPIGGAPPKAALMAAEAAKQLGAENASLLQANAELRKKVEELIRESDGFRGQLIDAGKQLAALRTSTATAEPAELPRRETAVNANTQSEAPRRTEAVAGASRAGEGPAKEVASAPAKPAPRAPVVAAATAQASSVAKPRAAKKVAVTRRGRAAHPVVTPPESYQCGDGRITRDPGQCGMVLSVPAEPEADLDPRRTYQCGDGHAVRDPALCRAVAEVAR